MKQQLEAREYRMVYSKNHWCDDPEYKGINTRWVTPEGQRFEVQFHTAESYHAKQEVTHGSYERLRNPLTARRGAAASSKRSSGKCVPGSLLQRAHQTLPDYRTKGH